MKVAASSLAPILRSDVQGRILARLFQDADAEYTVTDLAAGAETSFPTAQREVNRALEAEILAERRVGQARLIRANSHHPLFNPLRQVVLATYGPPAVIGREFLGIDGARAVVLFGSWAARYAGQPGRAPSDVDVLVLGDPDRDAVDDAAERAEHQIGVPVQATIRTVAHWRRQDDSFIAEIKKRPLIPVLIDAEDRELVGEFDDRGKLEAFD